MHNKLEKIKIAIFISGRGSNMESLIKASKRQKFPALVSVVITNNKFAKGIQLVKNYDVPIEIFDKKKFNKMQFETHCQSVLLKHKIEMICLAGFMQILSKNFINKWQNRIINIHPSYLPDNKGLNAQKQAFYKKASFTGCTVHFVNEKIDSGKIIVQKKVKIMHKDDLQSLSNRILLQEHIIYPKALKKVALSIIKLKNYEN